MLVHEKFSESSSALELSSYFLLVPGRAIGTRSAYAATHHEIVIKFPLTDKRRGGTLQTPAGAGDIGG